MSMPALKRLAREIVIPAALDVESCDNKALIIKMLLAAAIK
jgi:hypothetical protein